MKELMSNNPYLTKVIYVFMGIVVLIPMIGSVLCSGVNCDSAYYICIAERIADGYVPYSELHLIYPPLWFYIEALYKIIFHIPHGVYWPYLVLIYLFQIVNAYIIYRLSSRLDVKKAYAIFAAWLYLLMAHWLHGNAVLLEVPSITFCLFACLLVLEYKNKSYWHYLWIGGIATCSFLVKQYGLGTFALCLYLMLFISKSTWKQYVAFIAGYTIPIALCILLWGNSFINEVLLNGYGTQAAIDAGYDVSFATKIQSIYKNLNYFCYMVCPIVYLGWLFTGMAYQKGRLANILFAYCGILGYSLIFYFTGGQLHYYQYLLPFAILLIAELLQLTNETKWRYAIYMLVAWIICVSMYKTYRSCVYKQYVKGTERVYQKELARTIEQYVKSDETIYIVHGGMYHLYFTADVYPPNISTIGYAFGPMAINEKMASEQIQSADWVLRYSQDYPYESFFTDSLKHVVENYPVICLCDSSVLLYKMH